MDVQYGGFWRRVVAFSIDMAILFFISLFLLIFGVIALSFGYLSQGEELFRSDWMVLSATFVFFYGFTITSIHMFYFIYFHGNTGQTPGKMLLGLQVLRVTGERITYGIAFLRWVGYIVSKMFFWLGFIWVAIDKNKRGWHDYIAGTVVIQLLRDPVTEPLLRKDYDNPNQQKLEFE